LNHAALGDRFLWTILPAALIGAVLPFYLAKRWGKWWLAIAAVPLGIVASIGMSLAVAAILHFLNPTGLPLGNLLAKVIGFSTWSLLISPIAAFIGWRKGRGVRAAAGPSASG
jgi:hypothetical protein